MVPKNVIPGRIADALRQFPPFSMFPAADVLALAGEATVRVVIKGERLWDQGASPGEELLFLAQGRIEYIWTVEGRAELVDVRDVGDLLGLTALIEGKPFRAHVVEDSVCYGLPWARVRRTNGSTNWKRPRWKTAAMQCCAPPLSFFGKFVVERRGGREIEFDIARMLQQTIRAEFGLELRR
ncbi:MAG: Crp/Fnr family transcriptional regulator [Opitutaceae bacterium]